MILLLFAASTQQFAPHSAQSKHELPHMDNKLSGVSSGRCFARVSSIYGFVTKQQMSALITTAGFFFERNFQKKSINSVYCSGLGYKCTICLSCLREHFNGKGRNR